ncbi:MAG: hypothetical protein INH41_08445 [Myxococcaceae bacterium]|jgi:hypothetical protein|nr:hypothetical protein [Myxococcaceae bacterium]MCA3012415.1 hypothetical protein [Myxococcaceae bacterium]
MRASWLWGLMLAAGCSCEERPATGAPPPTGASMPAAPSAASTDAAPLLAAATWVQRRLTPQLADLQARIEYGPTTGPLEVRLELPPNAQVTRGRTYFVLDASPEPRVHVEAIVVTSEALPVKDLVLVVTGGGRSLKEPYRFGRR